MTSSEPLPRTPPCQQPSPKVLPSHPLPATRCRTPGTWAPGAPPPPAAPWALVCNGPARLCGGLGSASGMESASGCALRVNRKQPAWTVGHPQSAQNLLLGPPPHSCHPEEAASSSRHLAGLQLAQAPPRGEGTNMSRHSN